MKQLLIAGFAIGALIAPAVAADMPLKAPPLPPPPAWSWTGFYIGATAGYGWSQGADIGLDSIGTPFSGPFFPALANGAARAIPAGLSTEPKGFIGGGELGYNYQLGQWVLGIESDLSGANIAGSAAQTSTATVVTLFKFLANGSAIGEQKLDLFGTVRGRLGLAAADRFLIYATGGLAYGHVASNTATGDVPANVVIGPAQGSAAGMRAGWTVGGGFDWAFASNWSFKTEYLYYDLGTLQYALSPNTLTTCCTLTTGVVNTTARATFTGGIARAGIDYKF
jgi:outer membrane immunogenic protein